MPRNCCAPARTRASEGGFRVCCRRVCAGACRAQRWDGRAFCLDARRASCARAFLYRMLERSAASHQHEPSSEARVAGTGVCVSGRCARGVDPAECAPRGACRVGNNQTV